MHFCDRVLIVFAKLLELSVILPYVCLLPGRLLAWYRVQVFMLSYLYGTDITTSNEAHIKNSQPSTSRCRHLTRKWVAPFIGFHSITSWAELLSRIAYLNTGNMLMGELVIKYTVHLSCIGNGSGSFVRFIDSWVIYCEFWTPYLISGFANLLHEAEQRSAIFHGTPDRALL
jgi:hypothetical protein